MGRILKVAVGLLCVTFDSVRRPLCRWVGYPARSPTVVLMYHAVKLHERAAFARQMDLLLRVGNPVQADARASAAVDGRAAVAVTFDDAYRSVLENAVPILRERQIPFTLFVPTNCLGKSPEWVKDERHPYARETVLTPEELKSVRRIGAVIGSHGVSHRALTKLSGAEASAELSESRAVLQKIVGSTVDLFALPYGASNSEVLRLAKEAGYSHVFLSVPFSYADGDGFVRGRVEVYPSDWMLEYRLKVVGAYRWLPYAIAAKRRVMVVLNKLRLRTAD
jgi:peptidoglycan/xylan/chitin deacetylase (PgdA/CDA1 family)